MRRPWLRGAAAQGRVPAGRVIGRDQGSATGAHLPVIDVLAPSECGALGFEELDWVYGCVEARPAETMPMRGRGGQKTASESAP
jgi:hypothetical protein